MVNNGRGFGNSAYMVTGCPVRCVCFYIHIKDALLLIEQAVMDTHRFLIDDGIVTVRAFTSVKALQHHQRLLGISGRINSEFRHGDLGLRDVMFCRPSGREHLVHGPDHVACFLINKGCLEHILARRSQVLAEDRIPDLILLRLCADVVPGRHILCGRTDLNDIRALVRIIQRLVMGADHDAVPADVFDQCDPGSDLPAFIP